MLLYSRVDVETIDGFWSEWPEEKKVNVVKLTAEAFQGEYNKSNHVYVFVLWIVSIWAMITNLAQALVAKFFKKRKTSFSKILWEMGRSSAHISSFFVDRFSRFNHQSKVGAAGCSSLDIFYNYHENIKPQLYKNLEGWITRYWIEKLENRQAVTNRLKVVVNLLEDVFNKFINEPEIRIVSIASGSAQAIIKAMQKNPQLCIRAILIDTDETAIEMSRQKAKQAGLESSFAFINGATSLLEKVCQEFQPHIIEMIGFLDYRPKKKAIQLINRIQRCLLSGHYFLTCNIHKNHEKVFLDWVLLWPMIYRNEKQFAEVLVKGGFSPENISLFYEPFRVHGIAVCQK